MDSDEDLLNEDEDVVFEEDDQEEKLEEDHEDVCIIQILRNA